MRQRERESCTRNQRTADTLDDIAGDILATRNLAWAGWLAAQQLSQDDGAAIGELLDTIANRLAEIAERARHADQQEAAPDAA